jgi:D-alanyl-lipoteichoic acid acyltransferase DltB (MBOAT superfamily)
MSFISPEFAYAALVFFFIYWLLKSRPLLQKAYLTVSSYGFYATWSIKFTMILLAYSLWIWWAGEWIKQPNTIARHQKLKLTVTISLSLGLLIITKYYEFLRGGLDDALSAMSMHYSLPFLELLIPAGISFFTFQAITYLVWQAQQEASELKHKTRCMDVLLYLAFWPTLFAGPIFRSKDFFTQLNSDQVGKAMDVEKAIYFILLGLFQKVVLANWLSVNFVDGVYAYPENQNTVNIVSGIWAYSLQIFFDFSGYTLLVTGLSLLLGYQIPMNFKQPYLAKNLQDFWRRWHISLSTFIRDYIYFPLGGNKQGFTKTQINILIAMTLSGLWHGANTTFLIWGVLHGIGVIITNISDRYSFIKLSEFKARILTIIFVCLTWVFFRSDSLNTALSVLQQMTKIEGTFTKNHLLLILLSWFFFYCSRRTQFIEDKIVHWAIRNWGWRLFSVITVTLFLIIYTGPSGIPAFIYYKF